MNKQNIPKARILRKNMTGAEQKMWYNIRSNQLLNHKFRRQYPIGDYIVDFICLEKFLIIEIDGGGHNQEKQIEHDEARTKYLEKKGFQVIRFWNNEVDNNIEGVLEVINRHLTPALSCKEREKTKK
jgi:very-short-patch-repair endonuclease